MSIPVILRSIFISLLLSCHAYLAISFDTISIWLSIVSIDVSVVFSIILSIGETSSDFSQLTPDFPNISFGLDPLKMRTPCNGDFFTPNSVNRIGGQTYARC
jgi:hypothetical protein